MTEPTDRAVVAEGDAAVPAGAASRRLPWLPGLPDRSTYEHMTGLDASFLHAETDRTPLHIGALLVFEGEPFFDAGGRFRLDAVRARVAERLHLFPRSRKRVVELPLGLGRPVWVDDDRFDIAHHVRHLELGAPGGRAELERLCERLQMERLDRAHPLWELWFVTGLADGRVAMVEKVHHAMVDGVSGVEVAAALLDLAPEPPELDPPTWDPVPVPAVLPLLAANRWELLAQPTQVVRDLGAMLHTATRLSAHVEGALDALFAFLRPDRHVAGSSLNRQVGYDRRLASVTVPLDEVKRTGRQFEATVNDVVLAAVAGGLRTVLEERGEPHDHLDMRALVPVSIRADDEHLALGNRVSALAGILPVSEPSAIERLGAAREAMADLKRHHQADGAELILEGIELLPPALLALTARVIHYQPLVNVVVTNIPGPPFPLYFLGARMLESVPIVPLGGNLTIGIAILSYDGNLTLGLHADRGAWEDLDRLAETVRDEFELLFRLHHLPAPAVPPAPVPGRTDLAAAVAPAADLVTRSATRLWRSAHRVESAARTSARSTARLTAGNAVRLTTRASAGITTRRPERRRPGVPVRGRSRAAH